MGETITINTCEKSYETYANSGTIDLDNIKAIERCIDSESIPSKDRIGLYQRLVTTSIHSFGFTFADPAKRYLEFGFKKAKQDHDDIRGRSADIAGSGVGTALSIVCAGLAIIGKMKLLQALVGIGVSWGAGFFAGREIVKVIQEQSMFSRTV